MKKISTLLLDCFLAFTIFFSLLLWFWWLYPYNPLEIEKPLVVLNEDKIVSPGGILKYKCVFDKKTDKVPTINRRLVDGIYYQFPEVRPTNPVGHNNFVCTVEIPHSIPEGMYYLNTKACYQMNPIREVCVEYSTDKFEVAK